MYFPRLETWEVYSKVENNSIYDSPSISPAMEEGIGILFYNRQRTRTPVGVQDDLELLSTLSC